MPKYQYKATKDNKIIQGELEAKNKSEVAEILQNQGYEIISIKQKTIFNSADFLNINIGGIPSKEKTIFLRQLAYMIQAGLPINSALETLAVQVKNKDFQKVIQKVHKDVQEGNALSQSFGKHPKVFDKVIINLVKAGEESGTLDEIFDRLAFDYEKKQEFNSKVKGAFVYPTVILAVIVGVVALLMVVMIPSIKGLYKDLGGKELPVMTQVLINTSDFVISFWYAILVLMIAFYIGYRYYKKTLGGKTVLDTIKLKIPIFGKITRMNSIADFSRTLGMLLRSGVPIVTAMNLVADSIENQVFANEIATAAKRLEKGIILSQSISKDVTAFTPLVFQMLSIGEQTGKTDTTLTKLAEYYEKEVDQITSNLTKILEPFILILMAGVILLIALAVYLPVYSISS